MRQRNIDGRREKTMEHQATRGRHLSNADLAAFQAVLATPFGGVAIRTEAVGTEDECVAGILYLPHGLKPRPPRDRLAREAVRQVERYLADPSADFALPLKPVGTAFQRRVWDAIAAIPAGRLSTYGEVARRLHSGPRAVGQACGANRYPLAIPCHRVVSSTGLGGFANNDDGFHLEIKRWLLAHEGGAPPPAGS
jgi:methylated-DNA-[protein]-cysteine S-methyltransferase